MNSWKPQWCRLYMSRCDFTPAWPPICFVQREIEAEPRLIAEERRRLRELLGKKGGAQGRETVVEEVRQLNEELCALIREGRADQGSWRDDVIEHVRLTLVDKLKVADPSMIERAQTIY